MSRPGYFKVQPAGFVIFTQNVIPVQTSHPSPESRTDHERKLKFTQSYHHSASAVPGQIFDSSIDDCFTSELSNGTDTRFNPLHKSKLKTCPVGDGEGVKVAITEVGVLVNGVVTVPLTVGVGVNVFTGVFVWVPGPAVFIGVWVKVFVGV